MVVKIVAMRRSEILTNVFNACLEQGVFPEKWKVAKLVLLRKGTKPFEHGRKAIRENNQAEAGKHIEETNGLSNK